MMTLVNVRATVGQQMGLSGFDGTIAAYQSLDLDQQLEMTQRVINYVRQNPGQFSDGQVNTAQVQAGQANTFHVDDTSFDTHLFWSEMEANALELASPVANLGQQISNSVNLVAYAVPLLVLGTIIYFVLPYVRKSIKP